MSGAAYTTVIWLESSTPGESDSTVAELRIEEFLADGWQLHGGPIALPGERVLQALVKPAQDDQP